MLKIIAITLCAGALIASSIAAAQPAVVSASPYANENCKSGCVGLDRDQPIYYGAMPRTYRVCANTFDIKVVVDTRPVPVKSWHCIDVTGQSISIEGPGARAGLMPN